MILSTKNYLKMFLLLLLKNINFYQVAARQEQLICVIEKKTDKLSRQQENYCIMEYLMEIFQKYLTKMKHWRHIDRKLHTPISMHEQKHIHTRILVHKHRHRHTILSVGEFISSKSNA